MKTGKRPGNNLTGEKGCADLAQVDKLAGLQSVAVRASRVNSDRILQWEYVPKSMFLCLSMPGLAFTACTNSLRVAECQGSLKQCVASVLKSAR